MEAVEEPDQPLVCVHELEKPQEPVLEAKLEVQNNRITLERQSSLRKSLGFVFLFLILETCKQMVNYSLSINHDGIYPVPSTLLIVLAEVFKLSAVYIWAEISGLQTNTWNPSLSFSLPAAIYCLTNYMYLDALTVVSPPIWILLIQTRILYTALAYKAVFGREVTLMQYFGCILVVCSIWVVRFSSLKDGSSSITISILMKSQFTAVLSAAASISVELLLKNDGRSFCEQQWWLYVWGSFLGGLFMLMKEDIQVLSTQIQAVLETRQSFCELGLAVVSTALAGLCIPIIVKKLDTIVKDYLSASNNLVLSIITAVLFPSHFSLSWSYLLSLAILVLGIYSYEKKKPCVKITSSCFS